MTTRSEWPAWVLIGIFATVIATNAFDYSVLVPQHQLRYEMHRAIVDGTAPSPQRCGDCSVTDMPRIPITMPQLGESIAEATIVRIPFSIGDEVEPENRLPGTRRAGDQGRAPLGQAAADLRV